MAKERLCFCKTISSGLSGESFELVRCTSSIICLEPCRGGMFIAGDPA